jgi:hypothetical protein
MLTIMISPSQSGLDPQRQFVQWRPADEAAET